MDMMNLTERLHLLALAQNSTFADIEATANLGVPLDLFRFN